MSESKPGRPSAFFLAHRHRIEAAAALGPVVDLACGRGRHALETAELGLATLGIDRNAESLTALHTQAMARDLPLEVLRADIESEGKIPLIDESCGVILVFRFLYRPLFPAIEACLRPGGLLMYESFTRRQQELGWGPRRAAFSLADGELPSLVPGLEIEVDEAGLTAEPQPSYTARICARKPLAATRRQSGAEPHP